MNFEVSQRDMKLLAKAPIELKRRIIDGMTVSDAWDFDAEFENWAHKAQLSPQREGWRTWLMLAGRGFGKTRAGAEWIEKIARSRPGVRIALVGATIDEARRVMVEGVSGVLSVARRRRHKVKWEPSLGRLTWPNGSEAQIFSGDNPDGLRGPEHDFAWGYPAPRLRRGGCDRRAGTQRSSALPNPGSVLSRRSGTDGGVVGLCRSHCSFHRRRLEVRGADSRIGPYRKIFTDAGHLWSGRMGGRHNSRLQTAH